VVLAFSSSTKSAKKTLDFADSELKATSAFGTPVPLEIACEGSLLQFPDFPVHSLLNSAY